MSDLIEGGAGGSIMGAIFAWIVSYIKRKDITHEIEKRVSKEEYYAERKRFEDNFVDMKLSISNLRDDIKDHGNKLDTVIEHLITKK